MPGFPRGEIPRFCRELLSAGKLSEADGAAALASGKRHSFPNFPNPPYICQPAGKEEFIQRRIAGYILRYGGSLQAFSSFGKIRKIRHLFVYQEDIGMAGDFLPARAAPRGSRLAVLLRLPVHRYIKEREYKE